MKTTTILSLIAILCLTACGSECKTTPGPTAALTADQLNAADIAGLVADENAYRESLGQTALTQGLSCTVYTVTGGQYIQNDSTHTPTLTGISQAATFLSDGQFQQPNASVNDGLNVLPAAIRPNFINLFMLRCTGYVVVQTTGYVNFDLYSDDGSVLYLDGARLIDNDGNHGITEKSNQKNLRRGVHAFRLDFAQTGSGAQALILNANGSAIPAVNFQH
jgi:hypothetical protein